MLQRWQALPAKMSAARSMTGCGKSSSAGCPDIIALKIKRSWRARLKSEVTRTTRAISLFCGLRNVLAFSFRLERVRMRHRNHVVAGIDKMNFTCDTGRQIREKIEPRTAKFL